MFCIGMLTILFFFFFHCSLASRDELLSSCAQYIVIQTPFPPPGLAIRTYFSRGPDSAFSTETSYPYWQSPYTYHKIKENPGQVTRFGVWLKLFDPATGLSSKRFSRKFRGFLVWGEDVVCRVGYVRVG